MGGVDALIDQVVTAAEESAEAALDALKPLLSKLDSALPLWKVKRLLDSMRSYRRFDALLLAADTLLGAEVKYPYVRRQYAQALIERGQLTLALQLLKQTREDLGAGDNEETSETLGLLGRTYKQRFVNAQADRGLAARALNASIRYYREAYVFDPAWHGANLVALVRRAERDGIALDEDERSERVAQRLLEDLGRISTWTAWTHASAGEAHLALEHWQDAEGCFARYVQDRNANGFAIAGTVRQLREIWGFEPHGSELPGTILAALQSHVLCAPGGGELSSTPRELARLHTALESVDKAPRRRGPGGDPGQ
jgi:hypothetical protein